MMQGREGGGDSHVCECGGGTHACERVRFVQSGEGSEVKGCLAPARGEGKFLRLNRRPPPSYSSCLLPRRYQYHLTAAYLAWGLIWAKSGGGHVYGKGTGCQNSGAPWIGRRRLFGGF